MKNISLMLCTMLIALYMYGIPDTYGLSKESLPATRITYLFVHGGVMHLLVNVYSLLTLAFICDSKIWHFVVSMIIAITIPVFNDVPMIGISTVIYAMTGIIVMGSNRWWWFVLINLLIIGASTMMTGIAFTAHLYCFALGMLVGFLTNKKYGREIA